MIKLSRVFLFLVLALIQIIPTRAGIIGATYWVNAGGKHVIIYFDNHESGTPEEVAATLAFIQNTVLDKAATRTHPLLILVENYMRNAEYRALVQRMHQFGGHTARFLQQFDAWVDRDLGGPVVVRSIDDRTVPFLTFSLFCEWQKRHNGRTALPDDLYQALDETFASLTFKQVFDRANAIQDYIDHAPTEALREIFVEQQATMLKFISDAKRILRSGGWSAEDIATKPIKNFWTEKITDTHPTSPKRRAWNNLFIDYRGQEFWSIDLLWQLTNANMLWETINAPGDVAIFTGSYHAAVMETILKSLGFQQTKVAAKDQVAVERKWANETMKYDEEAAVNMKLISNKAFEWMIN